MKMDAYAWRNDLSSYEYKIQVNDIKHGDKTTFSKLFKEWHENGYGWNIKEKTEIKILTKTFKSEREWVEWARKCPIKVTEIKSRSGKEKLIQHSCKTRKKRAKKNG